MYVCVCVYVLFAFADHVHTHTHSYASIHSKVRLRNHITVMCGRVSVLQIPGTYGLCCVVVVLCVCVCVCVLCVLCMFVN